MNQYCLLVSSCDAYADCWQPFFSLLARYWDAHDRPPIYLNTETRDFAFPGLDIRCPRVGLTSARRLQWGERLRRSLDVIPFSLVLYLQEDYFVKNTVDTSMIDHLATLMLHEDISHISLVPDDRPAEKSEYPFLSEIDQRAEYRISAQAGLWNKAALRSYVRPHETVWEFEWYGTRRARRKRDRFLYVDDQYAREYGRELVFPYEGTGVEQGLWRRSVVEDLFARHGIAIDYSSRGFLEDGGETARKRPPRIVRAVRRLRSMA